MAVSNQLTIAYFSMANSRWGGGGGGRYIPFSQHNFAKKCFIIIIKIMLLSKLWGRQLHSQLHVYFFVSDIHVGYIYPSFGQCRSIVLTGMEAIELIFRNFFQHFIFIVYFLSMRETLSETKVLLKQNWYLNNLLFVLNRVSYNSSLNNIVFYVHYWARTLGPIYFVHRWIIHYSTAEW